MVISTASAVPPLSHPYAAPQMTFASPCP
jgi:hypothetical protein